MAWHAVVQVPAPAGEDSKRTVAMPRSELAVACRATVPFSGPPGVVIVTATVLKSAAAVNALAGDAVPAV